MDAYMCILMAACDIEAKKRRDNQIQRMRESLSSEAFYRWWKDEETERRHRELCASIEKAGRMAGKRKMVIV